MNRKHHDGGGGRHAPVRSYDAADLEDVYNLRAVLEGYAAPHRRLAHHTTSDPPAAENRLDAAP